MSANPIQQTEYALTLSAREVSVLRVALTELLEIYTRHEHLTGDIHALLRKLPEVPASLWAMEGSR
ncbi:MAG: hypothetical protein HYY02_13765 [Chloroflexi bacterium]|nr:hypothetical protein [Chloroflexota bacterium]